MDTNKLHEAIKSIESLPTLPTVLGQIFDAVSDPETSAVDLGRLIAPDQSLSAALLKLVNSAYYGFQRKIDSVPQAIVVLGFIEVRNLALTATAFQTLYAGNSEYDRAQLWRHSLAAAMASERCARALKMPTEGCFTGGLLHDIGKVALDKLYPEKFLEAAHLAHEKEQFIREIEVELFGMNHAHVGAILADHWLIPEPIVNAIRNHHAPEEGEGDRKLTDVVAVANYIAYEAGMGESTNGRAAEFPEASSARLGLSPGQMLKIVEDINDAEERIDGFLGALSAK